MKTFENHCYEFIIHRRENWEHAREDCKIKGGNLLSIHSIQEQNFIMSSLSSLNFLGKGVWLGLNDKVTEKTFVWDSGEPVDFEYWAKEEPGNIVNILPVHHEEDCVLLKPNDSGHWYDYPCDGILLVLPEHDAWVCKYDMSPVPTPNTMVNGTGTPKLIG
ncbi:hypothetical protein KUTeg_002537 [Tegillarca granosa]|uniref:C-type lectin domain-containing protein n=1 Tax=Tegillarca granosa TaxID=220873 RepID=A0ABQ9FXG0_TEGGR|nr:hypothetical protein KUTeg_002537 [Tegillarca granosa]